MIKNYLISALRFLQRNKLFAGINILGLSLALAASFIILLFVINELSYNTCFKNRKQIYRVLNYYTQISESGVETPYVLTKSLKDEFSQVKQVAPTANVREFSIKLNDEFIPVTNVLATNSDIFEIFNFPLIGQRENILEAPNSIVLSESQAQKFFPGEDPIGKDMIARINEKEEVLTVKGVFEDIPVNSTFKAECFVNAKWRLDQLNPKAEGKNAETDWKSSNWTTWFLLDERADTSSFDSQFRALEKKVWGENDKNDFYLQSLSNAYFSPTDFGGNGIQGNMKHIRIFSAIALLIILVAAFNYIILSTAVSTGRAKEIGIRKTNGASVQSIRNQMLNESVVLALLVFPIALFLAWLGKPYAEELFQTKLLIIKSNIAIYAIVYVALTLFIGLASGLYTSSILSKLNVIRILNNSTQTGKRKSLVRSALIVAQLVIFCSFVSSTLIIRSQYNYALNKNPGFYHKDILFINMGRNTEHSHTFMNSIKSYPDIISVGGTTKALPATSSMPYNIEHYQDKSSQVKCELLGVDYDFLNTMGIELVKGRSFSRDFKSDIEYSFILNESAVKALGMDDPIGKKVSDGTVIGVVKDFNLFSIREDIPPLILMASDDYVMEVAVRYKTGSLGNLLPLLKTEWGKIVPDQPFIYKTFEELNKEIYSEEKNLSVIITICALFSLLIATFGLFGVTLYTTKSRTKEIGIKKVLGSSSSGIIYSFLKENFIPVIIASLLSVPVTWYFMNKWLSNFSFKTTISFWFFVVAFVAAIAVVGVTVFFNSWKASRINPVEALKYE
jgi:putative ABC transport system permease protein